MFRDRWLWRWMADNFEVSLLRCSARYSVIMGLIKKNNRKSWREVHQERKKWREEKIMKRLLKEEKKKEAQEVPEKVLENEVSNSGELRTFSIAVPGSILANAQSPELRSYLAGQIARAACIYNINEVIVFDDVCDKPSSFIDIGKTNRGSRKYCIQFARLLQYLECPQYLRKYFFPLHNDLKYAGLMNPLDAPHHLRQDEDFPFREGITTDKPVKNGNGTYVYVGLTKDVLIDKALQPGLRVTVEFPNGEQVNQKKLQGTVVSPDKPLRQLNKYWGYSVRIADSLSEVFSKSPYPKGYDLTIGTSERGKEVSHLKKKCLKDFKHALIVFGGVEGLESALESDDIEVDDVTLLFDYYINTCPNQGSRTIRTEEAILISLAELRWKIFI